PGVGTCKLALQGPRYDAAAERALVIGQLAEQLATIPGVESAAGVTRMVVAGCCSQFGTTIEGRPRDPEHPLMVTGNMITPDYFRAMRIPMIRGRAFTAADNASAPRVVI